MAAQVNIEEQSDWFYSLKAIVSQIDTRFKLKTDLTLCQSHLDIFLKRLSVNKVYIMLSCKKASDKV